VRARPAYCCAEQHEAIDIAENHALRRSTAQNIELEAKDKDFGLQCCPRPEQPGHRTPDLPAETDHRADYQLIDEVTSDM
jgi:hypothetical protein